MAITDQLVAVFVDEDDDTPEPLTDAQFAALLEERRLKGRVLDDDEARAVIRCNAAEL